MKLKFAPAFIRSLDWYEEYYRDIFPEGRRQAKLSLRDALDKLKADRIGERQFLSFKKIKELPLHRSPFSILYEIDGEDMIVHLLNDRRGKRGERYLTRRFS